MRREFLSLEVAVDAVLYNVVFLKNGPTPASYCLFSFFSNTKFTEKPVSFSEIRTRIVRVEGEQTDHLTTTTAHGIWRC